MLEVTITGYTPENITGPLYQYDVGQVLQIAGTGLTYPPAIHFTNRRMAEALIVSSTIVDGVIRVNIPNTLLAEPDPIIAYLYKVDDTSGQTVHVIRIPIIKRPKPADWEPLKDEDLINYEYLDARLNALIAEWSGALDETQEALMVLTTKVNGVTSGAVSLSMGMYANNTVFNADGSITETGDGWRRVTTFNSDGSITEVYTSTDADTGAVSVVTKKTTFNADGSITSAIVD